jgi:hypothetical protein
MCLQAQTTNARGWLCQGRKHTAPLLHACKVVHHHMPLLLCSNELSYVDKNSV